MPISAVTKKYSCVFCTCENFAFLFITNSLCKSPHLRKYALAKLSIINIKKFS